MHEHHRKLGLPEPRMGWLLGITYTPQVGKIMAFKAVLRGFGLIFCLLLSSTLRGIDGPKVVVL